MKTRPFPALIFFLIAGALAVNLFGGPAGSGTITGKVTYSGTPPKARPIDMSKEPVCAKEHTTPVKSQTVVTGPANSLANVVVYVSAGDQGSSAPAKEAKLDQKGCVYDPHVVVMQVGQELKISNDDQAAHNIQANSKVNPAFNKAQTAGSPPIEIKYEKAEFIPLKCNIHPWMSAWVAVVNTSHSAVSGEDGSFTITGLAPGKYTVSAWHEQAGTQTQEVTIGAGETKNISFVFKLLPY
jgi:plastocyanin